MSVGSQFDGALKPGPVRVDADGVTVEAHVEDVDRLGASLKGLRVRAAGAPVETVTGRLPEAVRGALPERIVPVEVAPELGGAVLRSDPEDMRGGRFYELRTDGSEVSVERFRTGDSREGVPFTLTRDQLGRLVDGLGHALRP